MPNTQIKEPKSFEEQLIILKGKNVIIEDEQKALDILSKINYYRLSAYGLTLKDKDKDVYKNGVTFKQLKRIYDFDKRLRELLIYYLEAIEIEFRTKIAYYHTHDFGALGYRNAAHFKSREHHRLFLKKLEEGVSQSSKELFVIHHKHKYEGLFPFWVAIEVTSFGDLSRIYRNLLRETKIKVIRHLSIRPETVASWLHTLSYVRNICAHYGRLYGKELVIKPSLSDYEYLEINNRTVFSIIFILGNMLKGKESINFVTSLNGLIEEYGEDIQLSDIGFPEDWEELLNSIINK